MKQKITLKKNGRPYAVYVGDTFTVEVEDLSSYVQVEFNRHGWPYTYRDPSGTLRAGDVVLVPTVARPEGQVAWVRAMGRPDPDTYKGPIKDVLGRYELELFEGSE